MVKKDNVCLVGTSRRGYGMTLLPNALLVAVFTLLGYFMYGGTDGALGILLFVLVLAVASLVALIPYAGIVIFGALSYFWLMPGIADIANLPSGFEGDWLYWTIFTVYMLFGLGYTLFSTYAWRKRGKNKGFHLFS